MTGTLSFFSPKGWGFIVPNQPHTPDVFFHRTALVGLYRSDMIPGLRVEFDLSERDGKPLAVNVRALTATADAPPKSEGSHE